MPQTEQLYDVPECFQDDFLNEYLERTSAGSDYKFVYMGPAGSRTCVHTDVLHSNSWSAQIAGTKLWLLLPPTYAHLVEDPRNGICCIESFSSDQALRSRCIEVVQRPGQIIFVPAGWYHSVDNLTDSLSVNHNWIDSSGLLRSWNHLLKEYRLAERYIEDCRALTEPAEFEALVDRNATLQVGMSKADFIEMVNVVMQANEDQESMALKERRRKYGRAFLRHARGH